VYVNPAGRRLVGLAPDADVTATHLRDYIPDDERRFVREVINAALRLDGRWSGETRLRHFATGAAIPVSDTHFTIREPGGERVLGAGTIARDISASVASEVRARAAAEAANRAKDEFLAVLSHELRNPLSPIVTALELIRIKGPTESGHELDVIQRQVE